MLAVPEVWLEIWVTAQITVVEAAGHPPVPFSPASKAFDSNLAHGCPETPHFHFQPPLLGVRVGVEYSLSSEMRAGVMGATFRLAP